MWKAATAQPIMRNLYTVYKSYTMFGRNWIQESIATLKHNPLTEIGGNNNPPRKRRLWVSFNS
jgi:hypothetical protein